MVTEVQTSNTSLFRHRGEYQPALWHRKQKYLDVWRLRKHIPRTPVQPSRGRCHCTGSCRSTVFGPPGLAEQTSRQSPEPWSRHGGWQPPVCWWTCNMSQTKLSKITQGTDLCLTVVFERKQQIVYNDNNKLWTKPLSQDAAAMVIYEDRCESLYSSLFAIFIAVS